MERQTYQRPEIDLFCLEAERGFAVSLVTGEVEGFDREGWDE